MYLNCVSVKNKTGSVTVTAYSEQDGVRQISIECNPEDVEIFVLALKEPKYNEELEGMATELHLLTYEVAVVGNTLDDLVAFCDMLRGVLDLAGASATLHYYDQRDGQETLDFTVGDDKLVYVIIDRPPLNPENEKDKAILESVRGHDRVESCEPGTPLAIRLTDDATTSTEKLLETCGQIADLFA